MQRLKKHLTLSVLQLFLFASIACAPNLQKMVPKSEALGSKPIDKSLNIAEVSVGENRQYFPKNHRSVQMISEPSWLNPSENRESLRKSPLRIRVQQVIISCTSR